jgi:hypothetical protein
MPSRLPTPKTIKAKVSEAIALIDQGKTALVKSAHLAHDMQQLGLTNPQGYWDLVFECLHEVQDSGPAQCYAGSRPPQRSYEPEAKGVELFAYAWDSQATGCRMYLKFGIKNDRYLHIDCHPSTES